MATAGKQKVNSRFRRTLGMRVPRRRVVGLALLHLWVLLLLWAPGHVRAQSVKVGVLLPLSGRLAPIGAMEKTAFSIAAVAANRSGGIQGTPLEWVFADTAGDPRTGRAAAERLISTPGVLALTGGVSSAVAWEVATVAQERKTPFLVTTASADRITEKGLAYVFRISGPASEHFAPLSSFVRTATDIRTAAILWDQAMGEFLYRRFVRLFRRLGVQVILREWYRSGETDPVELILQTMIKEPHLVCVIARAETGGMLMQRARETGLNPMAFLGGTTDFATKPFSMAAGGWAEHVYAVTPWVPSAPYPRARDFQEAFSNGSTQPLDYHGAQAFASAEVMVDALRRTGELTPEKIQKALTATDMMTVFGPVRFVGHGQKTQQNPAPGFLVQWQGGEAQVVWPRKMATAPYIYPLPPLWMEDEQVPGNSVLQTGDSLRIGD